MKKIILLTLFLVSGLGNLVYANLTNNTIPVTKDGASNPPTLQNGSITDTGTASGPGNVGIGTTLPAYPLDVNGGKFLGLNGGAISSFNGAGIHVNAYSRGINMGRLGGGGYLGFAGGSYTGVPTAKDAQYFHDRGMTVWRLIIQWEYLQMFINGALDASYLADIDATIALAKQYGIKIILDLHNFAERILYNNGGITENFTTSSINTTSMSCSFLASYTQNVGPVVFSSANSKCYIGTPTNPVSPATGYSVSTKFTFNSNDTTDSDNGFYIQPMHAVQNGTSYYEFQALITTGTWNLVKVVSGVSTTLQSGSYAWATGTQYTVIMDINQANAGFINVSLNGTPLFTNGTQAVDGALTTGYVSYHPQRAHVLISQVILNVNGDTSSGGITSNYLVGTSQVPVSAVADVWSKLATHYATESTIFGYDIMNEPGIGGALPVPQSVSTYLPGSSPLATVTDMVAQSITAIRAVDSLHRIIVEPDMSGGGSANSLINCGGTASACQMWWNDPLNMSMYSFHYYFDDNHSGSYSQNYSAQDLTRIPGEVTPSLDFAKKIGVPVYIGEFGVPNNASANALLWEAAMDSFLQILDGYQNNMTAAWCAFSNGSSNLLNLTPTSTYSADRHPMGILQKHIGFGLPNNPVYSTAAGALGSLQNGYVATTNSLNQLILTPNVGVGTSAPKYSLDVAGTVQSTGNIVNGNLIVNSGNVGIGTTLPDQPFTLSGNARIKGTNNLYLGDDYNAYVAASQSTTPDVVITNHYVADTSTGGDTVAANGSNTVRTFTNSGTFTPSFTGNVNVLVIAGGGSGAANVGGGGGAGGVINNTSYAVTSGSPITVTVGAGGITTVYATQRNGYKGGNSVFGSLTAIGGGGGSAYNGSTSNANGGSGGGASSTIVAGTATGGQGNVGGSEGTAGTTPGGGGGGCGAVGADGNTTGNVAGNGGIGCAYSLIGTSTYYAGGGGGSAYSNSGVAGSGGSGGGGNGCANLSSACNGSAATGYGSGGGGGIFVSSSGTGGAGSNGIVIVSYTTPQPLETARFTLNGNVGIGSATPGQALDVQGVARMTGFTLSTSPTSGYVLTSDSNGVGTWVASSGGGGSGTITSSTTNQVPRFTGSTTIAGATNLWSDNTNVGVGTTIPSALLEVGARKFDVLSGGNVGIGSITPGQALDVTGTIRASTDILIGGNSVCQSTGTNCPSGGTNPWLLTGATGNVGISTTSNVGIGTTAGFGNALEVQGSAMFGTYGGQKGGNSNGLAVSGNLGVGTYNPTAALDLGSGNLTAGSTTFKTSGATLSTTKFSETGSPFVIGSASAASASTTTYLGGANANSFVTIKPSSLTANGGYIQFQVGNVGIGTLTPLSIIDGGNIGIGSTTPGQLLDVKGTLRMTGIGHISASGTAPTVASNDCGSTSQGTVVAKSTDLAGTVTVGTLTVTSCSVTFANTWNNAPICVANDDTNVLAIKPSETTTKITFTSLSSASGDNISWVCIGNE